VRLWLATPPQDAPTVDVSSAHYLLGAVHQQSGRSDQAKAEFQAAFAANPNEDAKDASLR